MPRLILLMQQTFFGLNSVFLMNVKVLTKRKLIFGPHISLRFTNIDIPRPQNMKSYFDS